MLQIESLYAVTLTDSLAKGCHSSGRTGDCRVGSDVLSGEFGHEVEGEVELSGFFDLFEGEGGLVLDFGPDFSDGFDEEIFPIIRHLFSLSHQLFSLPKRRFLQFFHDR